MSNASQIEIAPATEARIPGHLLGGVPELGVPAEADISRSDLVTRVLDAWGLIYPLRFSVQILLAFGHTRDPRIALMVATSFLAMARESKGLGELRDCPLQASAVAAALWLGPRYRAALIYLRWAALSGSCAERNNHIDGALEHLDALVAEMETTRGQAASGILDGKRQGNRV
jgi:hypothetical protein